MNLITLLKTFSENEIKSFRKYLKSPSTKSDRKVLDLYNYIVRVEPKFDPEQLSREIVFAKLFKGRRFNKKKLDNLYGALTRAAKNFLAFNVKGDDKLEYLLNLSESYTNKSLFSESNKINEEIRKKMGMLTTPASDYALKLRRLAHLEYTCIIQEYNFEKISIGINNLFKASLLQFAFDYMYIKTEMELTYLNYDKRIENEFIKSVFENINIEEWIKFYEKTNYVSKLHLNLHNLKFKTILEPDNIHHYKDLKKLFLDNLKLLDRFDRWNFFLHLSNYAMLRADKNIEEFIEEALDILDKMFESNSFNPYKDQNLDVQLFRNTVLSCNTVKEADWLQKFIEKYSGFLPPEHRANMTNYANAHLYSLRKEFIKSLDYSTSIKDQFFFLKIDVDMMSLRNYFELGEYVSALDELNSFRRFILKNRNLAESYKSDLLVFLKYYESLVTIIFDINLKTKEKKAKMQKLRNEIISRKDVLSGIWLIKKIDALIY